MSNTTLGERVAALESELAQIKSREAERQKIQCMPWWERRFGSFKDDPGYDEIVRLGAEYRKSQPLAMDDDV